MGGKKKAPAKKTAAATDEEDVSVHNFFKYYKRNCQIAGIEVNKKIKRQYEEDFIGDQKNISQIHLWDEIGWQGTRALMDALLQAKYPHLTSIRLWRAGVQDEGVRKICEWLSKSLTTITLDLLQCEITPVGCELIGRCIEHNPNSNQNLVILKLDHNPIGSLGLKYLAHGLAMNRTLKTLSLTYCQIGADATEDLFKVLLYQSSSLEEFNLTGNLLMNEGVLNVFHGLVAAKNLKKIYLADCQWTDDEKVMEALHECFVKNKVLAKYDLSHNTMEDDGVLKIVTALKSSPHVSEVLISEYVSEEVLAQFKEAIAANKPKKGKRKGKKKK